jgi:uracil-DNA glycosylase
LFPSRQARSGLRRTKTLAQPSRSTGHSEPRAEGRPFVGPAAQFLGRGGLCHQRQALITVHPSYLLRIPDEAAKAAAWRAFVADLALARELLAAA